MNAAICQICFCYFAENVVPRVLDCGHSFCSNCISNIIKTSPKCPDCRTELRKEDVTQYPKNFGLLHLANSFCKDLSSEDLKTKTLIPLKETLLEARNELLEKVDSLLDEKNVINSDLLKLENLIRADSGVLNTEDVVRTVNEIKINIKKANAVTIDANLLSCDEMLRLESFPGKKDYLFEIYKRIQNGDHVYVCHQVNDEAIFGRINQIGSNLYIHAMSKRTEFEENFKTVGVQFQEMKETFVLSKMKLKIFLKISLNSNGLEEHVNIELVEHPLIPQFIKLCTGECGFSYRGSKIKTVFPKENNRQVILEVKQYMREEKSIKGTLDYIAGARPNIVYRTGELVVVGDDDGGFQILKVTNNNLQASDVIGKVIYPSDIKFPIDLSANATEGSKKFIDCGVYVSLN